jgi:hypothetical protein
MEPWPFGLERVGLRDKKICAGGESNPGLALGRGKY